MASDLGLKSLRRLKVLHFDNTILCTATAVTRPHRRIPADYKPLAHTTVNCPSERETESEREGGREGGEVTARENQRERERGNFADADGELNRSAGCASSLVTSHYRLLSWWAVCNTPKQLLATKHRSGFLYAHPHAH